MRRLLIFAVPMAFGCGGLDLERPTPAQEAATQVRAADGSLRLRTSVGEFATWAEKMPPELQLAVTSPSSDESKAVFARGTEAAPQGIAWAGEGQRAIIRADSE
jgi:hypothetical protein